MRASISTCDKPSSESETDKSEQTADAFLPGIWATSLDPLVATGVRIDKESEGTAEDGFPRDAVPAVVDTAPGVVAAGPILRFVSATTDDLRGGPGFKRGTASCVTEDRA